MKSPQKEVQNSIVILFRYLPKYRLALFEIMEKTLEAAGLAFLYVTGTPEKRFKLRADSNRAPYQRVVRELRPRFMGMTFRYLFANRIVKNARTVIYEYSITNLNTWIALMIPQKHEVVIWGHGPGYMSRQSRFRRKLEGIQAHRADRVLVYTEPAKSRLVTLGVEAEKIRYLNNTFDWKPLQRQVELISDADIQSFKEKHSLESDQVVAFIGAMDFEKRIKFISQVLEIVWEIDPSVKFIFGGLGPDLPLLHKSEQRGQSVILGRVEDKEKALIASVCRLFINPGNTGLLAVDALILQKPILGTDVLSSPEKDYLVEGESHFTLPNTEEEFSKALIAFLRNTPPTKFTKPPSIEEYASRFVSGALGTSDWS